MSRVAVITCLAPSVKKTILEHCGLPDRASLKAALGALPSCSGGSAVQVSSGGTRGTGSRKKRAPSPYNNFVSSCYKRTSGAAQDRMRTCAAEWKSDKGAKLYRKLF